MIKKEVLSLLLILIVHAFILTKLIFFPYPEFFIYPYLTNHGLKPYSQIFDQHFPGLMFLPINFNNLGMTTPEIARIWLITVVLITQVLIFLVARQVLKDNKKALLVNLLYLFLQPFFEGWVLWIDSFLPLFLLTAFYSLNNFFEEKDNIKLVFFAGLYLGIGVVFKQVLIPLSGVLLIYLFLVDKRLKPLLYFLLGFLLPVSLMLFYLWNIGVLKDFWFWTATFNITTFAKYGRKWPTIPGFLRVSFVLTFAALSLVGWKRKDVQLLLLFTLGSLAAIYQRFDFVHLQPALPFILISTVLGFSLIWKKIYSRSLLVVYVLVLVWWLVIFYRGHWGNKVFFFDPQMIQISRKIKNNTKMGEEIFIFGVAPHLYFLSETIPVGKIFVFQFPWFMMETEGKTLAAMKTVKPNLVVRDRSVKIEEQPLIQFAAKLDLYISQNYETFDRVGDVEIMKRKEVYADRF